MSQQKYKTDGVVHEILDEEEVGNYKKQQIVLKVEGYNEKEEFATFEFFGKSISQLASAEVGDGVSVEWELKGRESKNRYWTTLSAFKLTRLSQGRARGERRPQREPERKAEPVSRFARNNDAEDEICF